ncbi:MAG: hypothetical protein HQM08_02605 [Candidatus Riflebacteria bacterium]|nr:hypothetical protein [Candidatus Riflebacteria bacterium]
MSKQKFENKPHTTLNSNPNLEKETPEELPEDLDSTSDSPLYTKENSSPIANQGNLITISFWTAAVLLTGGLVFILKQSIVRMIPLIAVFILFGGLLVWLYRKYLYRDLDETRFDYFDLRDTLNKKGMNTYLKIIDQAWKRLIKARDRAERIHEMISKINFPEVEKSISLLSEKLSSEKDEVKQKTLRNDLKEFEETKKLFTEFETFLKKFKSHKLSFQSSCRNLKLKIEMKDLNIVIKSESKPDEIDIIVKEIDKLNDIFEKVDS